MSRHDDAAELPTCRRCVMDTTDPDLTFDADGICSQCRRAERLLTLVPSTDAQAETRLAAIGAEMAKKTKGAEYQCLVGLSGGVDSSYVAHLAGRLGLRVLAVHFDNGWNSEIAVANIRNICSALDFELMTYVIDWEEFRDLQRAFLLASVIDVELVTDHAIFAAMVRLAREHRVPFVLSGTNVATEAILPSAWVWPKQDLRNIRAIHREFGEVPMQTYPVCGITKWIATRYTPLGPTYIELLNNIRYRKDAAIDLLEREVGWRSYGGKHHESVFTKYYQNHILPTKFGVDKRRPHLSSLVMNHELTRDEALAALCEDLYDEAELLRDTTYVCKKLGFSDAEWSAIMAAPPKRHDDYRSSAAFFRMIGGVRQTVKERSVRSSVTTHADG